MVNPLSAYQKLKFLEMPIKMIGMYVILFWNLKSLSLQADAIIKIVLLLTLIYGV